MKVRKSVARLMVGVALPLGTMFLGAGSANAVPGSNWGTPNTCPSYANFVFSGRGANVSGVYNANCIPAPSGNGVGTNGQQPMAGTVGNADNKNPQGQMPDALNDGNNGYECDGNQGIAQGNPAHTGCVPTPPECDPYTDPYKCDPPACDPEKDADCKDDLIA